MLTQTEAPAPTGTLVRVSTQIARAFRAEGVREVFGLMGSGNIEFLIHFGELEGCRVVNLRHENSAVAAADGYARAAGAVGVATVTHGPGLTAAGTSLVTAARARTPLVVFTGAPEAGGLQAMNQRAFIESCEATYLEYRTLADVADAFYIARTRRTPVVLGADAKLQEHAAPEAPYMPRRVPRAPRIAPQPEDIAAAADLLVAAAHPVILAGRGALGTGPLLDQLAALLGAPLATTLPVKGELARGPHAVGTAGGYAHDAGFAAFKDADCILAVGSSLTGFTTMRGKLFPNSKVIHVDVAAGKTTVALPIAADAATTLEALVAELRRRSVQRPARPARSWPDPIDGDIAEHAPPIAPGRLDPRLVMRELDRSIPDDAIVVIDEGHFAGFPCMYVGNSRARHFEHTDNFDAIGQAFPAAIGMAVARPDRTVFVFAGDSGFLYQLQELDTAARYTGNLVCVVMNDDGMGAEFHKLSAKSLDPGPSIFASPDFAGVARSMGVRGERIDALDRIGPVVRSLVTDRSAGLLDVRAERAVMTRRYRFLLAEPERRR